MRCLLSVLLCFTGVLPIRARTLIEQAYEAGELDIETALIYQLQAIRDPEAVPPEYREEPVRPVCGTPFLVQAFQAQQELSPEYGRRLAKLLVRPDVEYEQTTPSGRFRIHYDLKGNRAVDPYDGNGNGVPDYVDEVGRTLEEAWRLEVDELGFAPPLGDNGLGGGPEYDVYLVELGRLGAYGYTYPEKRGNTTHSYLELDNNYTDPIYRQTRGMDALHVTVAHEFNHAIQFGYYQGSDGIWWQEATATWMEEVAYPEVDDYLQYVPSFLFQPERALDGGGRVSSDFHIYGASIFAHFLDQRYERDLIRAIWEELGRRFNASLDNFDRVLRQEKEMGLDQVVSEFAIWNYFTGQRHREGYYHEGDKYPAVRLRDVFIDPNAPKTPAEHTDEVDHLASTYIHLEPGPVRGGVVLNFTPRRGQWRQQLILSFRDSVEIRPLSTTSVLVPGWDRYEDVVLALTVTEQEGFAYEYSVSVEYDPDLIDISLPVALRLGQNYPNPFRPEVHVRTVFPYDLDRASAETWLSIFAADGRLVRRFELDGRPRRDVQAWNGRNQDGALVSSGVYYGVLEAGGKRVARTLAVVRGDR